MATHNKPLICLCDESQDHVVFSQEELTSFSDKFEVVYVRDIETNPFLAANVMGLATSTIPTSVEKARKWIPRMSNLKAIISLSTGYEYVYESLKEFGIPMANSPFVYTEGTADHAMCLLLAAGCGLMSGLRAAMAERPSLLPPDHRCAGVFGSTLGILGMGSIGFALATRARAFQMSILYHNRKRRTKSEEDSVKATYYSSLDDMLPHCDYIVASCPLTKKTQGILSREQFRLMKPTAILVNVSRGKVVDTDALVEAVATDEIAQAALDVTDPEPLPPGHPLLSLKNVIVTPHIAACSTRSLRGCLKSANANLETAILEGKRMPNEISQ